VLARTGADVTTVSRSAERLELLPSGVTTALVAEARDLAEFDIVVDCTGAREGLELATKLVRPLGTIVLKTTIHGDTGPAPTQWVIDEITLVGSRCGPFAPALELLATGEIDPTPLISEVLPLDDGVHALDRAAAADTLKVLLHP